MRKFVVTAAAAALALAVASGALTASAGDRMVGGGFIEDPNILGDPTARIHEGMVLFCDATKEGSNLQITFRTIEDPNIKSSFHLTELAIAACNGNNPADRFDGGSHDGFGSGRCNGEEADISWLLVDGGRVDTAHLNIDGDAPGCELNVTSALTGGGFTFIEDPNI